MLISDLKAELEKRGHSQNVNKSVIKKYLLNNLQKNNGSRRTT